MIDVLMPDERFSVADYKLKAKEAIKEMYRQVGNPQLNKEGIIQKGLIIRHLVLPNHIYNSKNLPPFHKGDILLHGHTHIPACEEYDDYIYINPGSVSIPKENSQHSYIIFENGTFYWKSLDGSCYKKYSIS